MIASVGSELRWGWGGTVVLRGIWVVVRRCDGRAGLMCYVGRMCSEAFETRYEIPQCKHGDVESTKLCFRLERLAIQIE